MMSVTIVLTFRLTPEAARASANGGYAETFQTTRAFSGCESINAYAEEDDPTSYVIIERWASREHYERYLAWRRETGYFEKTAGRMVAPPVVRFLREVA